MVMALALARIFPALTFCLVFKFRNSALRLAIPSSAILANSSRRSDDMESPVPLLVLDLPVPGLMGLPKAAEARWANPRLMPMLPGSAAPAPAHAPILPMPMPIPALARCFLMGGGA